MGWKSYTKSDIPSSNRINTQTLILKTLLDERKAKNKKTKTKTKQENQRISQETVQQPNTEL